MVYDYENDYVHTIYRNISCLGILLHFAYMVIFGVLEQDMPFFNNLCSVVYYSVVFIFVAQRKRYGLTVALIHIETYLFVTIQTILFGWDAGFYMFLAGMASLVYFCPFRSRFIPYLFSLFHILLFYILHFYTSNSIPYLHDSKEVIQILFLFNSISSFIVILYAAYVSKVSAIVGRQELLEENENLQKLSNYDQLTGLYSRLYLKQCYGECKSSRSVLAIGDIDDFKHVNDTYGHICGDYILKELADMMRTHLDPNTFLCRWGGEEFIIIFPDNSLYETADMLTAFCKIVEKHLFCYENVTIPITITFGISRGMVNTPLAKWIDTADSMLYKGKQTGKNKVVYD